MAGGSVVTNMDEGEISVLKEALRSQQQLLQKLYVELEAEREASCSAANETLSKIWRLQEEKAAEKMEASQYKRMVEEKMKHAEEYMAMFEEIMFQKEMEISSLEYEMEAYKCKLLSVGFNERMIGEGGSFLTSYGEADFDDFSSPVSVRGIRSLPVGLNDPSFKLLDLDMQRPVDGDMDSELEFGGKEMQKKSETPECDTFRSYWEQIKRLEERVKALSSSKDVKEKVDSVCVSSNKKLQSSNMGYPEEVEVSSSCSVVRRNLVHDRIKGVRTIMEDEGSSSCSTPRPQDPMNMLEFDRHDSQSLEFESIRNIDQSMSVCDFYDVYEVPVISETVQSHGSQKQLGKQVVFDGWNEHEESDPILKEANEYCCKNETECVKKVLQYEHHEKQMSKPGLQYHWAGADTKTSTLKAHCEFEEINERLELLGVGQTLKQKLSCGGEEGLRMLKVIHEQLRTIKSELRDIKNKSHPRPDEPSLDSIKESVLRSIPLQDYCKMRFGSLSFIFSSTDATVTCTKGDSSESTEGQEY